MYDYALSNTLPANPLRIGVIKVINLVRKRENLKGVKKRRKRTTCWRCLRYWLIFGGSCRTSHQDQMDVLWKVEIITGCLIALNLAKALQLSLFLFPLYIFFYDGFELYWRTLVLKGETHKKRNEKQIWAKNVSTCCRWWVYGKWSIVFRWLHRTDKWICDGQGP